MSSVIFYGGWILIALMLLYIGTYKGYYRKWAKEDDMLLGLIHGTVIFWPATVLFIAMMVVGLLAIAIVASPFYAIVLLAEKHRR